MEGRILSGKDPLGQLRGYQLYDWIERQQLRLLNLPAISQAERGYSALPVSKMLQLVYIVSRAAPPSLKEFTRAAANIGTSVTVGPAVNKRWSIQMGTVQYTATATVGSRTVRVRVLDTASNILQQFSNTTLTASQNMWTVIGPSAVYATGANVTVQATLNYPLVLDPGELLQVIDTGAIDVADQLAYFLKVQEDDI